MALQLSVTYNNNITAASSYITARITSAAEYSATEEKVEIALVYWKDLATRNDATKDVMHQKQKTYIVALTDYNTYRTADTFDSTSENLRAHAYRIIKSQLAEGESVNEFASATDV